jgi:hypothetical protein
MPYETEREQLEHLNDLLRSYPKSHPNDSVKLFIELEMVIVWLDINDFNLQSNKDLWEKIKEGLATHPLRNEGEALCSLRDREKENEGNWWRNPRNWTTEDQSERDELKEIVNHLKNWKPGDDEYMVSNYFHVLEELNRSENDDLWEQLRQIDQDNPALESVCWKRYAAWTKKYNEKWWWWKLGEENCS